MTTQGTSLSSDYAADQARNPQRHQPLRPGHLHLVTVHDIEDLRDELARRNLPPDLEAKLRKLAQGDLAHRFIEQNCRTMIGLLEAVHNGSFKEPSQADCERLLRVLAYVRKDDDAVPDYQAGGFSDDQKEVRCAAAELGPLLRKFKAWRLQHQVPAMWGPLLGVQPGRALPHMLALAGPQGRHAWVG